MSGPVDRCQTGLLYRPGKSLGSETFLQIFFCVKSADGRQKSQNKGLGFGEKVTPNAFTGSWGPWGLGFWLIKPAPAKKRHGLSAPTSDKTAASTRYHSLSNWLFCPQTVRAEARACFKGSRVTDKRFSMQPAPLHSQGGVKVTLPRTKTMALPVSRHGLAKATLTSAGGS